VADMAVPNGANVPDAASIDAAKAMPKAKRPRDRRIDVFRGLALAMIFINHVPGTIFEHLTSRNFGFSDAAEGFVYISGTSAALAYGELMGQPRLWPGISRIWSRAWTLYLVHMMITAWVIGIAAATLRVGGDPSLFTKDNVQVIFEDMAGVLTGIPLMTHQIGYVNILPMYAVLLLACPWLILAARRAPKTHSGSIGGPLADCGYLPCEPAQLSDERRLVPEPHFMAASLCSWVADRPCHSQG
jgi:hypothetical protein